MSPFLLLMIARGCLQHTWILKRRMDQEDDQMRRFFLIFLEVGGNAFSKKVIVCQDTFRMNQFLFRPFLEGNIAVSPSKHSFILCLKSTQPCDLPQGTSSFTSVFGISALSRIQLTSNKQKASTLTTHTASFFLNTDAQWPLVRGRA